MTEQPAPYRPNPTLKRIENGFESLIFTTRWLMAPFYLGLVVCLAVMLFKFFKKLWEFILHAPSASEADIILGALTFMVFGANADFSIIVVFSAYEIWF